MDATTKYCIKRHHWPRSTIGVENKVWTGEQGKQLSDYQKALCDGFSGVPKFLIVLTPDTIKETYRPLRLALSRIRN